VKFLLAPFAVTCIFGITCHAATNSYELRNELRASDASADDQFGFSVATDGVHVFIGARRYDNGASNVGAVYVFELDGSGVLTEVAKLLASDGDTNDQLGYSLAIDGDVLVAGAAAADGFSRGAAYVFERPPGGWSGEIFSSAKLIPSDRATSDRVGADVAIDGDTIAVGAPGDDDAAGQEGAVYIFEKPPTGWSDAGSEFAKLVPAPRPGANAGETGLSIAIEAGVVVSGSLSQTQDSDTRQGRGLVFLEPPGGWAGVLNESAVLLASDGQSGDRLGRGVAIQDGVIALGAVNWDGASNNSGAVYVFEEPPGGWSGDVNEVAILTSSVPFNGEVLGLDLAMNGPWIVAGSDYGGAAGGTRESVYLFQRPHGGWSGSLQEFQRLEDDVSGENDFGVQVAIGPNRIVTGAAFDDLLASNAGRAYVYAIDSVFRDVFEGVP
jgi:hypothetical protein